MLFSTSDVDVVFGSYGGLLLFLWDLLLQYPLTFSASFLIKKKLFGKLFSALGSILLFVSWLLIVISDPVVAYLHMHFTLFLSHCKCNFSIFLAYLLQIILSLSILSSIFQMTWFLVLKNEFPCSVTNNVCTFSKNWLEASITGNSTKFFVAVNVGNLETF